MGGNIITAYQSPIAVSWVQYSPSLQKITSAVWCVKKDTNLANTAVFLLWQEEKQLQSMVKNSSVNTASFCERGTRLNASHTVLVKQNFMHSNTVCHDFLFLPVQEGSHLLCYQMLLLGFDAVPG